MKWIIHALSLFCRSISSGFQLMYGVYRLSRMRRPIVTVFGGGRVLKGSEHANQVYEFAQLAVHNGYSVLTGGGPGVMEAANCGARDAAQALGIKQTCTMGVSVRELDKGFINPCASVIKVNNFLVRKHLLVHEASAIVIFPGGIGTMDELFHVLNLAKHRHIKRIPVVLVDKEYWEPLVEWYHDRGLGHGFIKEEYRTLLVLADTPQEVLQAIGGRQE